MAPLEESIEAFVRAFETRGYMVCDDASPETRFEKVAIYALRGDPTHAARQLSDGRWTSKLGIYGDDIEHETLEALEGGTYGTVAVVMKRARYER